MNPKPKEASPIPFEVYEVALDMIRSLRNVLVKIRMHNPSLFTQIEKAGPSVPLNLNEGRRRCGRDRKHLWRIAAGSADEVKAALDVAEAFGYVEMKDIEKTRRFIDRILAMTWKMTR